MGELRKHAWYLSVPQKREGSLAEATPQSILAGFQVELA